MDLSQAAETAGFQLLHVASAESTNAAALRAVEAGADCLWVVADEQTAGRGRHGRVWHSPRGNLYASLGLRAPCPSAVTPLLGFVAGLSLAQAITDVAPGLRAALSLKWPNDCQIDGAKVAGILLEGASLPGGITGVAIGMGVNVQHFPEGLDQRATALAAHVRNFALPRLFEALSGRMSGNIALFDQGRGFAAIRQGWLQFALPLGTYLRVRLPSGERHGRFAGLDPTGHLLLETNGVTETIMVGDVFPLDDVLSPEDAMRIGG